MEDGTGVMGGGQVECEPALSPRAGDKGGAPRREASARIL